MEHVSVKTQPVLNGAMTLAAQRPRASRRTGGELIMWKMRVWKASVETAAQADAECTPRTHRSWPDWEQDQRHRAPNSLPASPFPPKFPQLYFTPPPESLTCCSKSILILIKDICQTPNPYNQIKRIDDLLPTLFLSDFLTLFVTSTTLILNHKGTPAACINWYVTKMCYLI